MVRRVKNSVEFIYCACGCGKTRAKKDPKYRLRKFIRGHNVVLEKYTKCKPKGKDSPSWKGGVTFEKGYKLIQKPEHHFADSKGYVREHRVIWEEHNKACLLPWADVHHKNDIPDDNRPENLHGMMKAHHMIYHHLKDMSDRICDICKSNHTRIDKFGHVTWYRHPETKKWLCRKCYRKIKKC